jgi:phage terminase large subunit
MPEIVLPAHDWAPRKHQRRIWSYLENGGRYAYQIAHRRWGKDDVALRWTSVAAFQRVGSYWHLLPEAAHARKAIWSAINPHTGMRRIDEAFPLALRKTTREQEMFIEFLNGSTWQVGGSDRYNTLVGSSPAGVIFSEWALANPAAWAYVRPILLENGGWASFITTPRGHNHAERMLKAARTMPGAFADVSTVHETGIFTPEALEQERLSLIAEYGAEFGQSIFDQEYLCSFEAAILGAFYTAWMVQLKAEKRLTSVPVDPALPVHFAFDLGRSDDTSIWAFQVPWKAVHVCGFHTSNGHDVAFYLKWLRNWLQDHGNPKLGKLYLPHDAKAKTLASNRSVQEQIVDGTEDSEGNRVAGVGWDHVEIVPDIGVQDGIQAVRKVLPRCWFDTSCDDDSQGISGMDALGQYRREYDEKNKVFRETPLHDWCSNPADAFRMLAVAYQAEKVTAPPKPAPKFPTDMTIDQLIARQRSRRIAEEA